MLMLHIDSVRKQKQDTGAVLLRIRSTVQVHKNNVYCPIMAVRLVLLVIISTSEAARILAVFPTPCISHQIVFRPLIYELAKRGHEITVITPAPVFNGTVQNLTEIDVQGISNKIWLQQPIPQGITDEVDFGIVIKGYIRLLLTTFSGQLKSAEVKKLIENKNVTFDLLIVEGLVTPTLALSHRFKVPLIRFSSLGNLVDEYNVMGSIGHPLIYPTAASRGLYNLTTFEKVTQLYNRMRMLNKRYSLNDEENNGMRRYFGTDMPPLGELANNINLMLMNVHHAWEMNRPTSLGIAQVGGLHLHGPKPLPEVFYNRQYLLLHL